MGNSYLITGGAGFIGNNFIRLLFSLEKNIKIRVLDKLTYSSNLENLKPFQYRSDFEFIKGDICDPEIVKKAMSGINVVVNFAAEVAVDRSIANQDDFINTDIFGVYRLLCEARNKSGFKKFIQVSTDEVYGHILEGSFSESSETKPRNPYAASKLSGERLAYSFFETYKLPVIITRGSNTYGPRAYLEKVIPLFISNLLDEQPVPLYGKGDQIRDWLFVDDHCKAIHFLIHHGINGEVYNIAGESEMTNLELTHTILSLLNKNPSFIKFVNDRPGHDQRYSITCSKLKKLGWKQSYSFERGIRQTIDWYKENELWWRPIKKELEQQFITGFWGEKA